MLSPLSEIKPSDSMSAVNRVQKRKQALAGFMRIAPEGTRGAW